MTFVAGTVLTAAALNTALASKTDTAMVQNAQTGTTYSFALADASKLLTTSNASPVSVTVTKQATVTWVTGTQLRIVNLGAGLTTLVADTGVTINGNVALNQYQGGTLIRTASDVWLFVPTSSSSSGMDLITPTSVVNATLSGGKITFSAAATVSINGCFTSAYDSYDLVWYSTNATDQEIRFRMRLAGSDNSASSYDYQWTVGGASSVSTTRSTAQAQGLLTRNLTVSAATMRITAPALAANTVSRAYAMAHTGINVYDIANNHAVATAYDGITLIPSTGTLTGTVRIYGLRNS